jgi:thiol-disulfide isomerase/thioredoxin
MKRLVLIIFLFSGLSAFCQNNFETIKESSGTIILKGMLSKEVLDNESSFSWMKQKTDTYKPDSICVAMLKKQKDSIYLIVFAGTWCEDTQTILPKFFKLIQQAEFPLIRVNLIGVDRSKKTIGPLAEALGVYNVPTMIVMKNGKEIGRVVEYGKYGLFDRELGEILSGRTSK